MKIGVDARDIGRDYLTGIGRFTLNFLEAMAAFGKEYEFVVYLNQGVRLSVEAPNIKKKYLPEKYSFLWEQFQLPEELKKDGIDLFYSPYCKTFLFSGLPSIITVHDIIRVRENLARWIKHKAYIRKAEKIVTVSEYSKREIVEKLGVKEEKIHVVHQAIGKNFHPGSQSRVERIMREHNISKPYLLYVGNFRPHKNVPALIQAYKGLPGIKSRYSLVGVAHREKYLNEVADMIRGESRILFIDFMFDEELAALYTGADLLIIPSLIEGFGLPPLEAMACGTPVLASSAASLPEALGAGAVFFDPNNADDLKRKMEQVLGDELMRKRMIITGLEHVKQFSLRRMADDFLSILRSG